jgi:hypothetical protein
MRSSVDGAAAAILRRFSSTEDSIARILARFRKPSPHETTSIESFIKRFFDRVDPAIAAYQSEKGVPPPATTTAWLVYAGCWHPAHLWMLQQHS